MEKRKQIAIAITAIGAVIAGWFCFGRKKKEQEETVETQRTTTSETTEEKKNVVEVEEKVEKPKKINLPRGIYVDALFEPEDEWGEMLDTGLALQADKRVIHVCQNKFGRREFLEFKLHIPRVTEEGNWSLPRDVDYLRQINESIPKIEEIWGKKVKHPVIGYFVMNVTTDKEEGKCLYCRIPKEIFSKYAGEKGDGLIEFVRAAREGSLGEDAKIDISSIEGVENVKSVHVEYIELMYSISIEITDDIREAAREKGFETLKFLVNSLEIEGRGKHAETYTYDRVLFHVPNQPMEVFYDAEIDEETGKKKVIETEAYF